MGRVATLGAGSQLLQRRVGLADGEVGTDSVDDVIENAGHPPRLSAHAACSAPAPGCGVALRGVSRYGAGLETCERREQPQHPEGQEAAGPEQREAYGVVAQRRAPRRAGALATHAPHQPASPARERTTQALDASAGPSWPWARSLTARRPPQPGHGRPVRLRKTQNPHVPWTWGSRAARAPTASSPAPAQSAGAVRRVRVGSLRRRTRPGSAQRTAVVPRGLVGLRPGRGRPSRGPCRRSGPRRRTRCR